MLIHSLTLPNDLRPVSQLTRSLTHRTQPLEWEEKGGLKERTTQSRDMGIIYNTDAKDVLLQAQTAQRI